MAGVFDGSSLPRSCPISSSSSGNRARNTALSREALTRNGLQAFCLRSEANLHLQAVPTFPVLIWYLTWALIDSVLSLKLTFELRGN